MNPTGPQRINPDSIKNILLIRLKRIGDVLMTTPAIAVLKKAFPQAFLTYVIDEPYRELVEGNPSLDKIIILPYPLSKASFIRYIKTIRKQRYDVNIDFHGGPRASYITLFSRARLKIGYSIKYKHFLYDIKIPRVTKEGPLHSVENHLNLVKALGISIRSPAPPLFMPEARMEEKQKIQEFISENKLESKKIVVFHIGAGNEFRDWGFYNILNLMKLLSKNKDVKIVMVGAGEDLKRADEIRKKCMLPPISLVAKLNLRELREIILYSSLFIGPDSGPMHIAATTQTPVIAYFGPTIPEHFSPWKAKAFILEKAYNCRPCKQKNCIYGDFRCLRSITPEEVYDACTKFI